MGNFQNIKNKFLNKIEKKNIKIVKSSVKTTNCLFFQFFIAIQFEMKNKTIQLCNKSFDLENKIAVNEFNVKKKAEKN